MWVSKIKINGETAVVGSLCKKHGISASSYPLSYVRKEDSLLVYFLLFLNGDSKNKAAFFRDLVKHDRIVNAEIKDHCIIGQIREPLELSAMYQYNIVHVEPIIFREDGFEIWTVASWDKKELIAFSNIMEERYGSDLLKMREEPISNVSVLTIHPELTDNQRKAMELAMNHGYYNIPRAIGLKELASFMKISYSTFQVHLRKAEKKLLPFFFEKSL